MMTEILSIIAVCISGAAAVCSACVPAILNAQTKKAELALKREIEEEKLKREKEQEYEAKFEAFYQSHVKVVTEFSERYVRWKNTSSETTKSELVNFVSKLSEKFRDNVQCALNEFANSIKKCTSGKNLDEEYKNCLNLILNSFGVRLSPGFPDILLSDILKAALKKQYSQLQNLNTDAYNRFYISE